MLTLSKLAKLAHVSVSTASKAFSMSREVHEETREEIFRIARENGCFKKFFNAKYPRLVIAILSPEFESRYYNGFLLELQKLLSAYPCEICAATTDFSAEREKAYLEYFGKYTAVDGIINISSAGAPAGASAGAGTSAGTPAGTHAAGTLSGTSAELPAEIPTVTIGKGGVRPSFLPGIEEAISFLAARGVRKIGFLGERLTEEKRQGYLSCLRKLSLPTEERWICVVPERFEAGGYRAMEQLLSAAELPEAVLCAYDSMAIGAMRCAKDHGIRIPEELAFVGMDNLPESQYLDPPLASVEMHTDLLCREAVRILMERINGGDAATCTIPATFVLRASAETNRRTGSTGTGSTGADSAGTDSVKTTTAATTAVTTPTPRKAAPKKA